MCIAFKDALFAILIHVWTSKLLICLFFYLGFMPSTILNLQFVLLVFLRTITYCYYVSCIYLNIVVNKYWGVFACLLLVAPGLQITIQKLKQ